MRTNNYSGPILAGIAAAGSALISSWILREATLAPALRLVIALAPGPFFLWFIFAELKWVRGLDEFHRRVVLDSLAMAFPASILVAVVVEGLQKGGFVMGWSIGAVWPFIPDSSGVASGD